MHVAHITASLTQRGGGIPSALQSLANAQIDQGITCRVIGHDDGGISLPSWPADCLHSLPVWRIPGLPWAPAMTDEILLAKPKLGHVHGLWSQASIVTTNACRRMGIPSIISPHGMLDPWALANSRWKKRIAAALFENRHLRGAASLHALCAAEAESIRAYGLKNPVCIIPNGVDLVDAETLKTEKLKSEKKILLFLGRLHPKKGLVNALRAWKQVQHSTFNIQHSTFNEWQFVIAGWDQGGHEAELKRLCKENDLAYAETPAASFLAENRKLKTENSQIIFVGPAFGQEKDRLLQSASAFILPSFSEGLPMSVLEAWSYRLPVLMTEHCNLPEGFAADAAIRIGTGVRGQESGHKDQPMGIDEGMRALFEMTDAERMVMGENGRALIEDRFTWPQVAAQMKEVYEWVLGGGPKPGCVRD